MKIAVKWLFALVVLCFPVTAMDSSRGFCEQGGQTIQVNTVTSSQSTPVQRSYPNCLVSVYLSGTSTLASIYSDNGITPLANPFTASNLGAWAFHAANGFYDVTLSSGGISLPFTLSNILLFDSSGYTPPTQVAGSATQVQYNNGTTFAGDPNLTWNSSLGRFTIVASNPGSQAQLFLDTSGSGQQSSIDFNNQGSPVWVVGNNSPPGQKPYFFVYNNADGHDIMNLYQGGSVLFTPTSGSVVVNGKTGIPGITSYIGYIYSTGGYLSAVDNWQAFNSLTDGALLRAYGVAPNTISNVGGYIDFAPVLYPPNGGSTCYDIYGNIVTQPAPLHGLSSFGAHDTIMWVSTSPTMPASGCGAAIPVETDYGLNINSYFLARGGLATDNPQYNAINALTGGVTASAIIAGTLYSAGTVTSTGTLGAAAYLGGYVQVGHSAGPPSAGTIATVTNPFVQGGGLEQGTIYWDDALSCLRVYDGSAWACLGSGGGGGTSAAGANTTVQFNSLGALAGSLNFRWNNSSQLLAVYAASSSSAGIAVATGYVQADAGFLASSGIATSYQSIQAPTGGVYAKSLMALNYTQLGNAASDPGSPTTGQSTFLAGAAYYNTGTACSGSPGLRIYNGTSWSCVGTGSGSPGGSNTFVQFNSSGSFGGSTNFRWDNSAQLLSVFATNSTSAGIAVATGFVQADAGFLATSGIATTWNAFYAPTGGMGAKSFTAVNYIQTGNYSGAAPPTTSGDALHAGALSYSLVSSCETVYNGSTWNCIGTGSGGSAAGADTAIQFNNAGVFGGTLNLRWNNAAQLMSVYAANSASAGIAVSTGYVQADAGFLATASTAVNYNAIQAPGGGMGAKSFTATKYIQAGSGFAAPAPTSGDTINAGTMYYDLAAHCLKVYFDSPLGFFCLSSATGVTSLNTFTGSVSLIGTASQVSVTNSANTITLSLPQNIATSSTPTFAGITANGAFNSTSSGSSIAFQNSNGNFQVNGNGYISGINLQLNGGSGTGINLTGNAAYNSIQSIGGINACYSGICASGQAYTVNGTQVINSLGQFVGAGMNVGSNGVSAGGYNVSGGFTGQTYTMCFSGSTFSINGSGSYTCQVFRGGVLVTAY